MSKLILVPTPIDDESPLEPIALGQLQKAVEEKRAIICVEDAKPGRRRWIHWGLPREAIDDFVLYNEHTREENLPLLLKHLQKGKNVYLMSDGGLPAFCDPGKDLVNACHEAGITVTSTPFPNSIALAVALSGFDHNRFVFQGFLPAKKEERDKALVEVAKEKRTQVLMDTPYRLVKLLSELIKTCPEREIFLALDLNHSKELLLRGKPSLLLKKLGGEKAEFILIIS